MSSRKSQSIHNFFKPITAAAIEVAKEANEQIEETGESDELSEVNEVGVSSEVIVEDLSEAHEVELVEPSDDLNVENIDQFNHVVSKKRFRKDVPRKEMDTCN